MEFFHDYCAKTKGSEPEGTVGKTEPADVTMKPPPKVAAATSLLDGWLKDDLDYFRPDTELPSMEGLENILFIHPDITISVCLPGIIKLHGMK